MDTSTIPVFDGHNDTLLRLWSGEDDPVTAYRDGGRGGHIDLPMVGRSNLAGGLFAMYTPSPAAISLAEMMQAELYDFPLPPRLELPYAQAATTAMAAIFLRLERALGDRFRRCTTVAQIRAAMAEGAFAAVLHLEGADCIDAGLDNLEVLYAAGLRSLGPVWSRNNIFADGVPLRYPSSPDIGGGLTDAGRALVRACDAMGVVVDLSHLTERGFWDVAETSRKPLVATHSNAHALTPTSRNLTDRQLDCIRERGGLVGLNFATAFLRTDGRMSPDTPVEFMVRHIDHLLERLGEDGVALGSDFDGATVPDVIGDCTGLPRLLDALAAAGYGEALIRKIAAENWLSLLARSWGEA